MNDKEILHGRIEVGIQTFPLDFRSQNVVKVTDRGGHSILYQLVNGVYYVPLMKANLIREARYFKLRHDDIYFPGYPRSGTHWTFEMAGMLLNGKAETIPRFKDHIENVTVEDFDKLPSPRIINSHMKLSQAPDDVILKRTKILYTLRDPKDVAVSVYRVYHGRRLYGEPYMGSFGDFLQLFLAGTVDSNGMFEHLRDAEKFFEENSDIPVFFLIYEDAIKKPVEAVQKLSDFLDLPRDDKLCQAIADKCHFSRMKSDKENYALKIDGENFLYRKGIVGDWRNHFSDEMLEDYYRVYDEKMAGSKFYDLYSCDRAFCVRPLF